MSVRQVLRSHTSDELTEWMAYFELERDEEKAAYERMNPKPASKPIDQDEIRSGFKRLTARNRKR